MARNKTQRSKDTGLTPQQQRAALLLMSGLTAQAVADEVGVDRVTIWLWRQLPTFQAFSNRLQIGAREAMRDQLFALQEEALLAIKKAVKGEGVTALRAAQIILDRVLNREVGSTNPRELIWDETRSLRLPYSKSILERNEDYERQCRELGIDNGSS